MDKRSADQGQECVGDEGADGDKEKEASNCVNLEDYLLRKKLKAAALAVDTASAACDTAGVKHIYAKAELQQALDRYAYAAGVHPKNAREHYQKRRDADRKVGGRLDKALFDQKRARTGEARTAADKKIELAFQAYAECRGMPFEQAKEECLAGRSVLKVTLALQIHDKTKGWDRRRETKKAYEDALAEYAETIGVPIEKAEEHYRAQCDLSEAAQALGQAFKKERSARNAYDLAWERYDNAEAEVSKIEKKLGQKPPEASDFPIFRESVETNHSDDP